MTENTKDTSPENLFGFPDSFFDSFDCSDPCKVEEPERFAEKVRKLLPGYLEDLGRSIDRCGKDPRFYFGFNKEVRRYILQFRSRAPRSPDGTGLCIVIPGKWNTSANDYARRLAGGIAESLKVHDELCSDLDCSGRSEEDRQEYVRRQLRRHVEQSDRDMEDLNEGFQAFLEVN
jgi:hypothetical protein